MQLMLPWALWNKDGIQMWVVVVVIIFIQGCTGLFSHSSHPFMICTYTVQEQVIMWIATRSSASSCPTVVERYWNVFSAVRECTSHRLKTNKSTEWLTKICFVRLMMGSIHLCLDSPHCTTPTGDCGLWYYKNYANMEHKKSHCRYMLVVYNIHYWFFSLLKWW